MAIKKVKIKYDELSQSGSPEIQEVLELEKDDILAALKAGKSYTAIAKALNEAYKEQFETKEKLVPVKGQKEKEMKMVSATITVNHLKRLDGTFVPKKTK